MFILISCSGCQDSKPEKKPKLDNAILKEKMIESNKHITRFENNQIENYIERRGWKDMKSLSAGLRLWEYEPGKGSSIQDEGDRVSLKYTLELINGVQVYSSEADGIKTFTTGKAEVEKGLEEAVLLLRKGSKAKIIIPSYLGFGFLGDGNKIPRQAVLIYDVEILL